MKRYLQCAEREATSSNLTKYCACHEKWPPKIWEKFGENRWNVISNARPIRKWSETVPSMIRLWKRKTESAAPPRLLSRSPEANSIENYNISRSGYHSKFHRILRLPRKGTLQLHQILRLPRKVTLELHQILRLPRKVTHELHQMLRLPQKGTHTTTTLLLRRLLRRRLLRRRLLLLLPLLFLSGHYYYYYYN